MATVRDFAQYAGQLAHITSSYEKKGRKTKAPLNV